MKAPSGKRLVATFGMSPDDAKLLRRFAHASNDGEQLRVLVETGAVPATEQYVRSLYSDPYDSRCWRVTVALHAVDVLLGTYGVEALGPPEDRAPYSPPYEYCNTGDAYRATLIYCRRTDTLSVGCWGDLAERHPSW